MMSTDSDSKTKGSKVSKSSELSVSDTPSSSSDPTPLAGPFPVPTGGQLNFSSDGSPVVLEPIDSQIAKARAYLAKLESIKNVSQGSVTVTTGNTAPPFPKLEFTGNNNINYTGVDNDFKVNYKPPEPKIYRGEIRILSDPNKEDQTIDEWIEYMERYFYLTRIPEKNKVTFALMYLKGAPYSYMMMLLNPRGYRDAAPGITVSLPRTEDEKMESEYSWEWMKQKLVSNFRPFNQQQLLRDQIKTLRQGENESVMSYVQSFTRIASQILYMTSPEELSYFRAGLKPHHLSRIDSAEGLMTLQRAITLSAQQEAAFNLKVTRKVDNSSNSKNQNYSSNNNSKNKQNFNGRNNYSNNNFQKRNNFHYSNSGFKNSNNSRPLNNNSNNSQPSGTHPPTSTASVTVQNSSNSSLNNIYSNLEYSSDANDQEEYGDEDGAGDEYNYLANVNNSNNNNRSTGLARCHKCNKTGHFVRNCPEWRNSNQSNYQYKKNAQSGKGGAH